jgi:hypothetical protein
MTSRPEPATCRLPRPSPAAALKLILSAGVGIIFFLILRYAAFVEFPRQVAAFRDNGMPAAVFQQEFLVERGAEDDIWTVEVVFPRPLRGRHPFEAALNGVPIGGAAPRGRSLLLEFPGSRLGSGPSLLEIRSDTPWTFRRVRVKNFTGYSSGFLSAVIFPRDNRYPAARRLPSGALPLLGLALLCIMAAVLNAVPEIRVYPGRRVPGSLKKIRYLIPGLLLCALVLPVLSRFRVWFEWRTVLILALIFYGLAYLIEWTELATRLLKWAATRIVSPGPDGRRLPARGFFRLKMSDRLSALLIVALGFICLVKPGPVVRSGDSLEYVAMLVSWAEFGRPYVTSDSAKLMEMRLGQTPEPGENEFFVGLKERFPSLLKNGGEMDLPHFWLYSLAASIFYYPVRLFSLNIGFAFMLLHLLLVVGGFLIVRRALGPAAGLSLLLIIFFSPLIWFVNKVHVELFTVILASVGAALLAAENWAGSALSFALASTQNPPFAILAGLAFALGFLRRRWAVLRGQLPLWIAALVLAAAQPAYYLLRLGILNPVVATGAAKMNRDVFSLRKMFSFIVDPDIGLLANWPVALPLLLLFAVLAAKKRAGFRTATWLFLLGSLPVLLWSQSRTLNLNHGGTYLISRYTLWYLYVFFLVLWQLGLSLANSGRAARRAWFAAGLLAGAAVLVQFWPSRPEEYLRPTRASLWLYDRCPGAYDPMPEIFTERYRRIEENLPENVWAVSNPSGNKILVRRGRMMNFPHEEDLAPIPTCPELDQVLVYREAARRFEAAPDKKYLYINGMGRQLRRTPY